MNAIHSVWRVHERGHVLTDAAARVASSVKGPAAAVLGRLAAFLRAATQAWVLGIVLCDRPDGPTLNGLGATPCRV